MITTTISIQILGLALASKLFLAGSALQLGMCFEGIVLAEPYLADIHKDIVGLFVITAG